MANGTRHVLLRAIIKINRAKFLSSLSNGDSEILNGWFCVTCANLDLMRCAKIFAIIESWKLTVFLQKWNAICYWPSITWRIFCCDGEQKLLTWQKCVCGIETSRKWMDVLRAVVILFYNYCLEFLCHSLHSTDFIFIMNNLHLRTTNFWAFQLAMVLWFVVLCNPCAFSNGKCTFT